MRIDNPADSQRPRRRQALRLEWPWLKNLEVSLNPHILPLFYHNVLECIYRQSALNFKEGGNMNVYLYAEISGQIDSRKLWHDVEVYGVNVTDLHVKTLIYGEVSMRAALLVIDACAKYGKIQAHIT